MDNNNQEIINNEVKQYLDDICAITERIFIAYELLNNLEENNQKDSKYFKKYLELLILMLEKEKALYTYFVVNPELASYAAFYLLDIIKKTVVSNYELIIRQNKEEIKQARILNKLKEIALTDPELFFEGLKTNEELFDLVCDEKQGIAYAKKILPVLEDEMDIQTAAGINELVEVAKGNQKGFLHNAKYYLSFLNSKIEQTYIQNGFKDVNHTFDEDLSIASNLVPDYVKEEFRDVFASDYAMEIIDTLKDLTDDCYEDDEESFNSAIILSQVLSTTLLFLSESAVHEINEYAFEEDEEHESDDEEEYEFEDDENLTHEISMKYINYVFANQKTTKIKANKDLNKGGGHELQRL